MLSVLKHTGIQTQEGTEIPVIVDFFWRGGGLIDCYPKTVPLTPKTAITVV